MQTGQIRPGIATNDCSSCGLFMPPQATSILPSFCYTYSHSLAYTCHLTILVGKRDGIRLT